MTSQRSYRAAWLLLIAWCALLTAVFYAPTIPLPPFFDDFVHYPYVAANNLKDIWFTIDELPYYRPLQSTLWRLTYSLGQGHMPAVDRAANLILYAANGALVGILALRLWAGREDAHAKAPPIARPDWWRAWLSATLFLLFPFSYQAVPWIGSLGHILVTTLILLSLYCYDQMRRTGRRTWAAASLILATLAPFAHENGVLVMPLLVVVELTTPREPRRWRYAIRTALIWSLPYLLYLPIWFSLPRIGSGALFPNNVEGLLQNTAYFLQGAFYPMTGLGGWLYHDWNVNDMVAVGGLSLLGLVIAVTIQITQRATLRSLLPWLWWLLAVLPAIPFLLFEYVINGPRLLMLASVGIAWLWTDVGLLFVRGAARGTRGRILRTALASLVLILLLGQNALFIRQRVRLHQVLGDGFAQVIEYTAAANGRGQSAVVVNMPSWLTPVRSPYALGHDGVLFWPDYVPPEILMAAHSGELGQLAFVRVDAISPDPAGVYFGLTGPAPDWSALLAHPAAVLRADFTADEIDLLPVGGTALDAEPSPTTLVTYAAQRGQVGANLLGARAEAIDDRLRVVLRWQVREAAPSVTAFVHVLDDEGRLIAQVDGDPLGGSLPLAAWPGGKTIDDVRWLEIGETAANRVLVGLYDRQSGDRLEAVTPGGAQLPDGAYAVDVVRP